MFLNFVEGISNNSLVVPVALAIAPSPRIGTSCLRSWYFSTSLCYWCHKWALTFL
ncbi:MAG: hypothetical protein RM022_025850 [Nostoc sp. EfeVER01]|uniref:hypothetical protein n=1 Tax=Nostoc sp. EfeVER01 TaxID=3075406 RepID=UPI002AD33B63|nr:hypothetical protein [Nostoc sp. EfeVER01]